MNTKMYPLEFARVFATYWHGDQRRKYTNELYIVHPWAVGDKLVEIEPDDINLHIAGWLHDVLEDTKCSYVNLLENFGPDVYDLVVAVTDSARSHNRATRKKMERQRLARASPRAKTLKLADLIDNSDTILKYDRDFSKIYLPEKRLLLDEALEGGNPQLWAEADRIVQAGLKDLGL
jgi:(p)ppGpp synthase/HD superfamily hydrolase